MHRVNALELCNILKLVVHQQASGTSTNKQQHTECFTFVIYSGISEKNESDDTDVNLLQGEESVKEDEDKIC